MRIRLRMYCAFSGTSSFRASSTDRTLAMACTVVQTPQKRWVKSHASRGSRPRRIFSMPRHMVHDAQALLTALFSTSTSMRRCPSIRVIGSIVIRFAISACSLVVAGCLGFVLTEESVFEVARPADIRTTEAEVIRHVMPLAQWRGENRSSLHRDQETDNPERDEAQRDENLNGRGKIQRFGIWSERQRGRTEAVNHPSRGTDHVSQEHRAQAVRAQRTKEQDSSDSSHQSFEPENTGETVDVKCRSQHSSKQHVQKPEPEPAKDKPGSDACGFIENFHIHGSLPNQTAQHRRAGNTAEGHEHRRAEVQNWKPWSLP